MAEETLIEQMNDETLPILQKALEEGKLEIKRDGQWVRIHHQSLTSGYILTGSKIGGPFRVSFPEAELKSELIPFKDLSAEQLKKVVDALAKGECEIYSAQSKTFAPINGSHLCLNFIYRAKPRTLDVPWNIIDKEANALFVTPDGKVLLTSAPEVTWDETSKSWEIPVMHWASLQPLLSFDVTDIEQANRKSLRPKE